jgi:Rps23 Pro-64 3,4-dihydroxylase Tpa1-like proline 4-hydroxylase
VFACRQLVRRAANGIGQFIFRRFARLPFEVVNYKQKRKKFMREEIVTLIVQRLENDAEQISRDFQTEKSVKTRFAAIDNLLPEDLAKRISAAFPPLEEMRLLDSFREKKYTSKSLDKFDSIIEDITFAFQDERVIETVARLTGIEDAVGDPHLYAGGISAMAKGHFLQPHLDNSHDYEQKNYRVLNLLYYITPGWKPENGGNLELWNEDVTEVVEIPSLFNRLVLMSTNDKSWHSVNEVKAEGARCCVSNYYFSPNSPNGYETTHVTYFQARPEQTFKRLITKADSDLRSLLRKVKKTGFSKKDLYESEKESKK